jgi:hypothetical protein
LSADFQEEPGQAAEAPSFALLLRTLSFREVFGQRFTHRDIRPLCLPNSLPFLPQEKTWRNAGILLRMLFQDYLFITGNIVNSKANKTQQ